MNRKTIIAGNWKMNKTPSETTELVKELKSKVANAKCGVIICVPFIDLFAALEVAKGSSIKVGAQNMHFEENGAYTGEISVGMLKEIGVEYVIIGHSERRQYFNETDETVNKKVLKAIDNGLAAILCVGETLEQRENGTTEQVVTSQTQIALSGVSEEKMEKIIIAYEPVWAIGTGKTATSGQADEVCGIIRNVVASLYNEDCAESLTIQYGGSMNAANAEELLGKTNVDGGLIGGASLKSQDFAAIVEAGK